VIHSIESICIIDTAAQIDSIFTYWQLILKSHTSKSEWWGLFLV